MRVPILAGLLLLMSGVPYANEAQEPEGRDPVSRWITVEGVRVHYRESASTDGLGGLPLLFVHGWCGSSYDFLDLMRELPQGLHLIAPDLPGCGRSQKDGINFSPGYFVEFLAAFLRAVGIPRAIVVGHSMGGGIAANLTVARPALVERLVLIDPYGLRGEEGALRLFRRSGFVVDLGTALNNRFLIEFTTRLNVFHDHSRITKEYLDSVAETCLGRDARRAQATITKRVLGHSPVDDLLHSIAAPTIVLWGEFDRVLAPKWAAEYAGRIPGARLVMIPDSGHMPQIEAAPLVTSLLLEFLGSPPKVDLPPQESLQ